MGLTAALRRLAFARPTAFPVLAPGGAPAWHGLLDGGSVRPTGAPHDADVLAVAGDVPPDWDGPILRLFETLALPRAAVWLGRTPERAPAALPLADPGALVAALADPGAPGNGALLPDQPPVPWRGEGDHGQGGTGMMGGKPYGRPMAMTGADPDGLALADTAVALGPFFPHLPTGLVVRLRLQGQRIRAVEAVDNLVPEREASSLGPLRPVAQVEAERIERHLLSAADQLHLLGLEALAERFRRHRTIRDPAGIARLYRLAERTGIGRILGGIGTITPTMARANGLSGAAARAAGVAIDPRQNDEGYRGLDLRPATAEGGDAWARWRVRRDEALQSARLLTAAGGRETRLRVTAPGEGRRLLDLVPALLAGSLWSEAVATLASLDLDMAEASAR